MVLLLGYRDNTSEVLSHLTGSVLQAPSEVQSTSYTFTDFMCLGMQAS